MKKLSFILCASTTLLFSCGSGETKKEMTEETPVEVEVLESVSYTVDPESSTIIWAGEVAGVYGHSGEINVKEGSIDLAGESISGGTIVIDMATITPTDSAYKDEDGHRAEDLVSHLSTGDFFLVDSFPTAHFVIKSHEDNKLIGDLTVRGITKEESIDITGMDITEEGFTASGKLTFNRQDYDVKWVHFMKDMVLSNDISLDIEVQGSK